MDVEDIIWGFIVFLLIFVAPAIPGVLLWFFLQPATFWQKLAWVILSTIIYLYLVRVIVKML